MQIDFFSAPYLCSTRRLWRKGCGQNVRELARLRGHPEGDLADAGRYPHRKAQGGRAALLDRELDPGGQIRLDPELLEILVCPETRQPVSLAPEGLLASLNQKIQAGELRNRGGQSVSDPLQEGLLREDGRILYPVDDSIPVMLIEESIEVQP